MYEKKKYYDFELTLFEKIWVTLLIVNAFLSLIGCILISLNVNFGFILFLPLIIQIITMIVLVIIIEIILHNIWNLDCHIFPSLFK